MKQVFFAYCNRVIDGEEVLGNIEKFFMDKGWNLVIPENSLGVPIKHPLEVDFSIVEKSALVIIELTSKRIEMAMVHEHAVNKGLSILYIRRRGEEVLESLKQYEKASFEYESPDDVYGWLEKSVDV